MMKKYDQNQWNVKAFTLIEVMVAIAIVSIMATVLLLGYSSSRIAKDVENAGQEAESVFRVAQNYALTGKKVTTSGMPATAVPCYFMITWTGGSGSYTTSYIYKNTSGDTCSSAGPSTILAVHFLDNGVVFSTSGSFYFSLPHANIFDSAGPVATSKGVVFGKMGTNRVVCVYAGGRMQHFSGSVCP